MTTDQMKVTEQYVPVVLFIMLYKVVCGLNSQVWPLFQMTATKQYFPMVLFITLYIAVGF